MILGVYERYFRSRFESSFGSCVQWSPYNHPLQLSWGCSPRVCFAATSKADRNADIRTVMLLQEAQAGVQLKGSARMKCVLRFWYLFCYSLQYYTR